MLLIKNGHLINPANGQDEKADIIIEGGIIKDIGKNLKPPTITESINAAGMIVAPGLVDIHVHFRDPGYLYKEDIESGAKAAARGGYTTVVLMGNTKPPVDNTEVLNYVLNKGKKTAINIKSCANISCGMNGHKIVDMARLKTAGAVGFTDDGMPLTDDKLVRAAMVKSAQLNIPLSFHEEDPDLIKNNGINEGLASNYLGIEGSLREAEITMIRRDIALAAETGAKIVIQHISTKEGVELVRQAKKDNLKVHAEATPHHFSLTEEAIIKKGAMAKMNPPLRSEKDRRAIIRGLKDGTIDIIATDHAPHSTEEKNKPITEAPSGIIGLETALSLGIRELTKKNYLTINELIDRMSTAPAKLYNLPAGDISIGKSADIIIFDPISNWIVKEFQSKSNNSPFIGEELPAVIHYTICNGKIIYKNQ